MKVEYKGYELEAKRESCWSGWDNIYFNVFRKSDGLEVICDFTEEERPVADVMAMLKGRVDEFIDTNGASEELEEYFSVDGEDQGGR
jgi:hypothetical protein